MNIDIRKTIAEIGKRCALAGVQYLVVRDPASIFYLTGCMAHSAGDYFVLVTPTRVILFTDPRYAGVAKKITAGNRYIRLIIWDRKTPYDDILKHVRKGYGLGLEQDNDFTVLRLVRGLTEVGEKKNVEVRPIPDMLQNIRSIKTQAELRILRKAHAIADEAFRRIKRYVRPGVTELEISQKLNYELRQLSGSDEISFSTTIASGPNGAFPHATVTKRKIRNGDMVTFDFGCTYNGYHTDTTRTLFVGKPRPKALAIYQIVMEAQAKAQAAARPGMTGQDVDRIAREYIEKAGYGKYFTHSTGHGVGLNVHEQPSVTYTDPGKNVLEVGSVFSIEPGIYIDGFGGVRIENTVVMTKRGAEPLSKLPTDVVIV